MEYPHYLFRSMALWKQLENHLPEYEMDLETEEILKDGNVVSRHEVLKKLEDKIREENIHLDLEILEWLSDYSRSWFVLNEKGRPYFDDLRIEEARREYPNAEPYHSLTVEEYVIKEMPEDIETLYLEDEQLELELAVPVSEIRQGFNYRRWREDIYLERRREKEEGKTNFFIDKLLAWNEDEIDRNSRGSFLMPALFGPMVIRCWLSDTEMRVALSEYMGEMLGDRELAPFTKKWLKFVIEGDFCTELSLIEDVFASEVRPVPRYCEEYQNWEPMENIEDTFDEIREKIRKRVDNNRRWVAESRAARKTAGQKK